MPSGVRVAVPTHLREKPRPALNMHLVQFTAFIIGLILFVHLTDTFARDPMIWRYLKSSLGLLIPLLVSVEIKGHSILFWFLRKVYSRVIQPTYYVARSRA